MKETNFNIDGFAIEGHDIVLKAVDVETNDEGTLSPVGKYSTVANLNKFTGQYGPYLMNPLAEEDRSSHDTYFIGATNPDNRGGRKPVATLRRKSAGAEEAEHVCGLFLRERDGVFSLMGTDVESKVRYGIFLNQAKDDSQKIAVNQ